MYKIETLLGKTWVHVTMRVTHAMAQSFIDDYPDIFDGHPFTITKVS